MHNAGAMLCIVPTIRWAMPNATRTAIGHSPKDSRHDAEHRASEFLGILARSTLFARRVKKAHD